MKKSRFSESRAVGILKDSDAGVKVQDILLKYNISSATYYKWKSRYGGMEVSDVKRLKELKGENRRLKQMFVDVSLENRALKDLIEKKL
jgi:putative transposase